ncbi:MAG: helix-turn-helix transcriptional regulator [bacterium]|nr:helix-turn-helix transcriptional regulator [bacterium]
MRFARNVLGKKAKDFAEALSIAPEHLSRIENSEESISASLDKHVRYRLIIELVTNHGQLMADTFDIEEFSRLIDTKLPVDDGHLGLFVSYTGSYIGSSDSSVDFEFREAA